MIKFFRWSYNIIAVEAGEIVLRDISCLQKKILATDVNNACALILTRDMTSHSVSVGAESCRIITACQWLSSMGEHRLRELQEYVTKEPLKARLETCMF